MNETAFNQLILRLAAGDENAARRYVMHFRADDRAPAHLRGGLACRVAPEVMAFFERLAPWLAEGGADSGERIKRALRAAGRAGLTRQQVRDRVQGVPAAELRHALDDLVARREVHIERRRGRGRSADVFRLPEFAGGIVPANLNQDPFAYVPVPLE